jgi:hypothetical protein
VYVLNKLEVSVADRGGGIDHAQHPESVIVHVHEVFITHDGPTSTVLDKLASTQKQTKTEEDRGRQRDAEGGKIVHCIAQRTSSLHGT